MNALECVVDCAAVAQNILRYGQPVILMAKARCYGLGLSVAARVQHVVHAFGVAYGQEGSELRAISAKPILVTTPCWTADEVQRYDLIPMVGCVQDALRLKELRRVCAVHLALNSGMNRFGIASLGELRAVLAVLNANPYVRVAGAYTHYAAAESYVAQNKRLLPMLSALPQGICIHTRASSTACFAGVGALRVGLGAYRDSVRLLGRVVAIRALAAGDYAGYDGVYRAPCAMRLAVISGGYADGLCKALRGHHVLIGGRLHPIVAVCMDVCLVALRGEAQLGDEVEILGATPNPKQISLYEMYTGLHGRVKFRYEGEV